jgi:ADP-heptose:LPS heptosyltransferase
MCGLLNFEEKHEGMKSAPIDMTDVKRLLIIKMSALGDIAKTIPTVDAIRAAMPHLRIGWVVRQGLADLLVGNPSIDDLFVAPRGMQAVKDMRGALRRFRPDIVLDMQGLFVSGCLARVSGARRRYTWQTGREFSGLLSGNPIVPAPEDKNAVECLFEFARLMGVAEMPAHAPAYLTAAPDLIARAEDLLADVPQPRVGMHVGASVANKTWPAEHWIDLAQRLIAAKYGVVLFGGKQEQEVGANIEANLNGEAISLVGKTTPRELAAAISRCRIFLGGDTGATHIATLVHTPTIALMGATDPLRVGPYGKQHTVISLGLSCSPCYRHPTCAGRYDCMRGIEPARVFRACEAKLAMLSQLD